MPLDAQHPLFEIAELNALADDGMVIERHGVAKLGDIVRDLLSQPCDIRCQFVDTSDVPIEARVDLLEAQIHLLEPQIHLFEPPVDLLEPPVVCGHPLGDLANLLGDLAQLPGHLSQQLIDGCDIGTEDAAHAIGRTMLSPTTPIHPFGRGEKRFEPFRAVAAND
jgi:hypothetical protein